MTCIFHIPVYFLVSLLIIFGTFDNLLQQKHDQLFFCDWWDHCIFVCHCAHILVSAIKIHWSGALEYSLQTHLGTIWFFHVLVCGFNYILHIHVGLCHSPKEGVHLESKGNCLDKSFQIWLNGGTLKRLTATFRCWGLKSIWKSLAASPTFTYAHWIITFFSEI